MQGEDRFRWQRSLPALFPVMHTWPHYVEILPFCLDLQGSYFSTSWTKKSYLDWWYHMRISKPTKTIGFSANCCFQSRWETLCLSLNEPQGEKIIFCGHALSICLQSHNHKPIMYLYLCHKIWSLVLCKVFVRMFLRIAFSTLNPPFLEWPHWGENCSHFMHYL